MSLRVPLGNEISEPTFNQLKFDENAFETYFRRNFLALSAFCRYQFGFDADLAKEVVHTTFIKLWETFSHNDSDMPVRPFLYRVITNQCLDIIRHNKVVRNYQRKMLDKPSLGGPAFTEAEVKQLQVSIAHAVEQLPEQMRKIFRMSRQDGLKYSEIAMRLNISVKTVETQMSRALARLREMLVEFIQ